MTLATHHDDLSSRPLWLAAGTLVATIHGEMPVEEVQPGMRVLTRSAGLVRVRAVGTAAVRTRPGPKAVELPAGALGQGLPEKVLTVVGDQRVFVFGDLAGDAGDRFIPAANLSVARDAEEIALVRLEFATAGPVAVLANGAWFGSALSVEDLPRSSAEADTTA